MSTDEATALIDTLIAQVKAREKALEEMMGIKPKSALSRSTSHVRYNTATQEVRAAYDAVLAAMVGNVPAKENSRDQT